MRGSYVSHLNATHLNAALPQHSGQLWLTVVRICGCRDFNQAIRFRPGEAEHQRKLLIKEATNAVEPGDKTRAT